MTLKSRLAVVQATDAGILTRAYDGPALLEDERVRSTVWPGSFPEEGGERGAPPVERVASAVSATRLRDSVVVAFMNRSHLATFVVDPFGGGPPRGPLPIVPSLGYRNPGMGGEDVSGAVGICFPGGSDDADRIRFVVVGPDGEAVGEPVTVVSGLRYAAACDVAAARPGEWFVVWWNAARSERRHSISGARVRLR